ncbi:hypothetical protein [Halobellus salinisoli]|uniref:hypothetical protein n=1 Tax=Halobellus salinisoli TaxID=3108500 RepID=UPI0030085C56
MSRDGVSVETHIVEAHVSLRRAKAAVPEDRPELETTLARCLEETLAARELATTDRSSVPQRSKAQEEGFSN